jgi:hypothetical protein
MDLKSKGLFMVLHGFNFVSYADNKIYSDNTDITNIFKLILTLMAVHACMAQLEKMENSHYH